MSENEAVYEIRFVKAIRGTEARAISKAEQEGWELVSQTQGRLQTRIEFRRPKPKARVLLWVIGGAAFTLVLGTIITIGVISERNATEADPAPVVTDSAVAPSGGPESDEEHATPEPTEPATPAVIRPETNVDFAEILAATDYCAPAVAEFAEAYRGQTIAFDGNVGALNNHDGASTRYDILIGSGDFSETSQPGPAFQFRDVNLTNDLHYVGDVPDSLTVGTNLGITATVDNYEPDTCLFLIRPVATSFR